MFAFSSKKRARHKRHKDRRKAQVELARQCKSYERGADETPVVDPLVETNSQSQQPASRQNL